MQVLRRLAKRARRALASRTRSISEFKRLLWSVIDTAEALLIERDATIARLETERARLLRDNQRLRDRLRWDEQQLRAAYQRLANLCEARPGPSSDNPLGAPGATSTSSPVEPPGRKEGSFSDQKNPSFLPRGGA